MNSVVLTAKALLLSQALMSNAYYVNISPNTTLVDFYQPCGLCTFGVGQAKSAKQFIDKTNDIRHLPVSARPDYDECTIIPYQGQDNIWYCYSTESPYKYCSENKARCTIDFQGKWGPSGTAYSR